MGWVALKALLLYLTAVLGFRVGQRRTLADLSPFDFVAAVAVGSIVGRVPNASDASYLAGLATLAALLLAHWGLTRLRRFPSVAHLLEQTPRLLVAQDRVLEGERRRNSTVIFPLPIELLRGLGSLLPLAQQKAEPAEPAGPAGATGPLFPSRPRLPAPGAGPRGDDRACPRASRTACRSRAGRWA